ncbi:MAG: hypothetical protein ACYTGZ_00980 [Planctomycetota bacterium]|jgi:hypothetical protein
MGKKKDCFGQEDYTCMTPSCPYAKECIQAVWEKRLDRAMARRGTKDAGGKPARRSRARMPVKR